MIGGSPWPLRRLVLISPSLRCTALMKTARSHCSNPGCHANNCRPCSPSPPCLVAWKPVPVRTTGQGCSGSTATPSAYCPQVRHPLPHERQARQRTTRPTPLPSAKPSPGPTCASYQSRKNTSKSSSPCIARGRLAEERTALYNRLRGLIAEFGIVLPQKVNCCWRLAPTSKTLPGYAANLCVGDMPRTPTGWIP